MGGKSLLGIFLLQGASLAASVPVVLGPCSNTPVERVCAGCEWSALHHSYSLLSWAHRSLSPALTYSGGIGSATVSCRIWDTKGVKTLVYTSRWLCPKCRTGILENEVTERKNGSGSQEIWVEFLVLTHSSHVNLSKSCNLWVRHL